MKDPKKSARQNTESKFPIYQEPYLNMRDFKKQEIIPSSLSCIIQKKIFIKMNNEIVCEIPLSSDSTCEWLIKEVT